MFFSELKDDRICGSDAFSQSEFHNKLLDVSITTPDGIQLAALFGSTTGKAKSSIKIAILVHGFAAEKTENGLFLEAARELNAHGCSVLSYDWRGLGGSGGDFADLDLETHVKDFKTVVRWVKAREKVSSAEICVVGFSLGAVLVGKAVRSGEHFGTVVFWSPAARPSVDMWPRYNTEQIRYELNKNGYITKSETKIKIGRKIIHSLRETDLADEAFNLGIPLLICHGSKDLRIPIGTSKYCYNAAKHKNSILFAEFKGASHSFRPHDVHRQKLLMLLSRWVSSSELRQRTRSMKISFSQSSRRVSSRR